MWRLLLFLSTLHVVHSSCPEGPEGTWDLARNGQCRGLYETASMPANSINDTPVKLCKNIGALPVIIHDEEDQHYWTALAENHYDLILGLVCNAKSKRWEWGDGSAVDYKPPPLFYNSELNTTNCNPKCRWAVYSSGEWGYYCGSTAETNYFFCTQQLPPLPVPSADGCESFADDSDDGVCYQVGAAVENWQEAQIICRSFGANVASIHNEKENSFIRRLAVSKAAVSGLFLGATLSGKGNDFAWIDGSKWDYDNFYSGFPMKGFGDCLLMDTESTVGQWVNVDCSTKTSVVCMRKQHYTVPGCPAGPFEEGQILYSPGFPFDASTPCDFILSVDAGKKVEVEVLVLEANSWTDQFVLLENYFGGTVVANLTGEVSDTKYTTTSSNFMRVSWKPNRGANVRGAMFTFRGV